MIFRSDHPTNRLGDRDVAGAIKREIMELRKYQREAVGAVFGQWALAVRSTLLVMATGTGKTIVFATIIEQIVRQGGRVLVLAHRGELLDQAADKIHKVTGLRCAVEKADETAVGCWENVVLGSVQTMMRDHRRVGHTYTHIIIDEAHHAPSVSYREILDDFPACKVLGVTATTDRGDKRDLGEVFETIAYEYTIQQGVEDGYLCPIVAKTVPLDIDLNGVKTQAGDLQAQGVGTALDPYLGQIADALVTECANRKTIVFLPLIATSRKFLLMLRERGVNCNEVNGGSHDRGEVLAWFSQARKGAVLLNAMLLTEGYDQPDVDCICVLRATKNRMLYTQMIGRGTRIADGKENLLILDFLWHVDRLNLCRPGSLYCEDPEISKRVAEILAENAVAGEVDVLAESDDAESTAQQEREEMLAKQLAKQRAKRGRLVDPLQYSRSTRMPTHEDTENLRRLGPPTEVQKNELEKFGINPDVDSFGVADDLLKTLRDRRKAGATSPKQIRILERYGFRDVGTWTAAQANKMITRIAANRWMLPRGVDARNYRP